MRKSTFNFFFLVMGYDTSGGEEFEEAVRFNGETHLQFKHRFGRRFVSFKLNQYK